MAGKRLEIWGNDFVSWDLQESVQRSFISERDMIKVWLCKGICSLCMKFSSPEQPHASSSAPHHFSKGVVAAVDVRDPHTHHDFTV